MDPLRKIETPEEQGLAIAKLMQTGVSLENIMEVPHDKLDQTYALATAFFNDKQYHQVVKILPSLILVAPKEKKYWMLLGSAYCLSQHWQEALVCHSMASILNPSDPYPYYYSALSYLETGAREDCLLALDNALVCARKHHEYYSLEQTLQHLKEDISRMNVSLTTKK